MKRILLTHGSARVSDDCPQEVIDLLNKISVLAYNKTFSSEDNKKSLIIE